MSGDGCKPDCTLEFCGDGVINNNNTEGCDDGNTVAGDGCFLCRVEFCGDGRINNNVTQPEECDDANNEPGDGCDANCVVE
eukprot:2835573-Rhodomonas_salina.1